MSGLRNRRFKTAGELLDFLLEEELETFVINELQQSRPLRHCEQLCRKTHVIDGKAFWSSVVQRADGSVEVWLKRYTDEDGVSHSTSHEGFELIAYRKEKTMSKNNWMDERQKNIAAAELEQYLARVMLFIGFNRHVPKTEIQEHFPYWNVEYLLEELLRRGKVKNVESDCYVIEAPPPLGGNEEERKDRVGKGLAERRKREILAFIEERKQPVSKELIQNLFPYPHSKERFPELDASGILILLESEGLVTSELRTTEQGEIIVYSVPPTVG